MTTALRLPGRPGVERMLNAALERPAHAYLFHGPRGSGKEVAAQRFLAAVLATEERRVAEETHPDLYVVEPEGEAILIDQIRALRADLHLRPFEAERRAYLLRGVETLGDEAANALLKSLEEPPPYAVFVLVCHDRARLLPTIESRCQAVRFGRLARAAVREEVEGLVPMLPEELDAVVRAAAGDLARARRLAVSPEARARRERVLDLVRDAALDPAFDAARAAAELCGLAGERGDEAEREVAARKDALLLRLGTDKASQRERRRVETSHAALAKRRRRRAETDEYREAVDTAIGFVRDVLCVAVGAEDTLISSERLSELRELAQAVGQAGAERSLAAAREVRRSLDQPVIPSLALESLFHGVTLSRRGSSL